MFWGSSAEIRRLQSELAAARSEVAALQAQNGDLKGELASVKATSAEHEAECNTLRAVLAAPAEAWTIERLARSVAMSRATYARLYGGQPCRDGTEMAYAYNYYASYSCGVAFGFCV